jgi:uncharacterized protein (DUF305 family)
MISSHAVKATLTAITLGVALGLAACGGNDVGSAGSSPAAPPMSQMPSARAASSAASASPSTAAQFNTADVSFVQGMLPHHEQAVEMSDTLLKQPGVSAGTTHLAQQIKAAQQPEITMMEGWLKAWGQSADPGMGGMDHGGMGDGMASEAEMKKLDQADGSDAEKMYLEMMTQHHQGAITMANTEITDGQNPAAVQQGNTIATSQQTEIDTMQQLLGKL